ncbi:MAG: DUF1571 domain-containing protein [Planctomycetota bacterium]
MPREPKQITRRKLQFFFGLVLAGILYAQFQLNDDPEVILTQRTPRVLAAETVHVDPFEKMIRRDPLSALKDARDRHLRTVSDYECVMVKQELLESGMTDEQEIKVKYRQAPYSVYMDWIRNPGLAARVLYVKGKWTNAKAKNPDERELAVAQPGKIAQLFVKSLKQPVRGSLAKDASRRYLDEFGFAKTLDLLINYCDVAKSKDELKLELVGESHFDGRPVWVVRRTLPYTDEAGFYPDRTAEIYIDKEYRVPVAVYCFSDDAKDPKHLLGKYEYRDIRFGVGLTDKDFEPKTYGM